ncbi:MAG: hypothetical protein GC171_06925 [Terrimonas sp.]|nr:hypothetical protein [Terrimonas sp.]
MKKTAGILALCIAVFLSGCFDVIQDLTIRDNGSGVMTSKMDMGSVMAMMSQMGGMGDEKIKMDTSMALKSFLDSVTSISEEEKALLQNATVEVEIDSEEGAFNFQLNMPFEKIDDIAKLKAITANENWLGKLFSKIGEQESEKKDLTEGMGDMGNVKMPMPDDYLIYQYQPGKISRKANTLKLDSLSSDEMMQKMKEGMDQGMPGIRSVYAIHLPRPVKKAEGKNIVVSDDKKTVTIENTMDDLFDDPSKFEFTIEF